MTDRLRGVVPILITPFDDDGRIDDDSLRNLVEFNISAGVHGLGVALGSEIFKLSEAERDHVTRIVVAQTRGRVPVIINTGAQGTDLALLYSKAAEALGADMLMITPPSFIPASADEVCAYYRAISDAVTIPIMIQDVSNASVGAGLARRISEESERVRYIKVESLPVTARVADMAAHGGSLLTILGGAGGGYFIEELRRGSQGTMPFCTQPEAFVEVWKLFQAGNERRAREVFDRMIAPINRIAAQGNGLYYHVHKTLLRHRGIIRNAKVRAPAPPVEPLLERELQEVLDELYPR